MRHHRLKKAPPAPKQLRLAAFSILFEPLKQHKGRVIAAILTLFLTAFVVLAAGWGIRQFIDEGLITGDRRRLDWALLILTGTTLFIAFCSYLRSYLVSWLGEAVIGSLRRKVFEHLLHMDVSFFDENRPGELTARLTTDTNLMQLIVGASFSVAMRNFLLMIGGIVMMFLTSPKLTLYTLVLIPFILIPLLTFGNKIRHYSKENQRCLAHISGFFEETFSHIKTVQGYGHEAREAQYLRELSKESFQITVKRILARSTLVCLVMLLAFCGVNFVLWCGGQDVIDGVLSPGALSAFLFYAVLAASSAGSFSELYGDLQRTVGAAERLLSLLSLPKRVDGTRALPSNPRGIIAIHNVTFAYPTHPQKPVVENFTLSVAPGEKIAIVGLSGSGKSTIFSMLMKFYAPQSGSIFIEGLNLKELKSDEVRRYFAMVGHDAPLFSATLYENILYAQPDATPAEINYAIHCARLDDVIAKLPHGLKTYIGTKGTRLSAGQKQRVALARAILHNPTVLLLDEATNALDAENEALVQKSIYDFMSTRTTLVIAHSLTTVLQCDRIVVMHDGKIEAVGTHAELMEQEGSYRRFAKHQLQPQVSKIKRVS